MALAASGPTSEAMLPFNHLATTLRFTSAGAALRAACAAAICNGLWGVGPTPDSGWFIEKLNDRGESGVAIGLF